MMTDTALVEDTTAAAADTNNSETKLDDKTEKRKSKKVSVTKMPETLSSKFEGNGVAFRAKLFGTADVPEARGEEMCQKAMQLLKAAVKTTGEHKQKIILRVSLKGIILVDATTMLPLYEHAVNRISFIAKDVTDNRAFGYVVGSPDGKHVFYGIRSEKAAEQVVLTLRDLFQAVFELKKTESETKKAEPVQQTPVETKTGSSSETQNASQTQQADPAIGDAEPAKNTEVQKEDSSANLLSLLDDLAIMEPNPQTAAFSAQPPATANAWGAQSSTSALPNVAWSGAAPTQTQNDPFVVPTAYGQHQQSLFAQTAQQPLIQQQPGFTAQSQQQQQQPFQAQSSLPSSAFSQQQLFTQPQQQVQPFSPSQTQQALPFQQQQSPFVQQPFSVQGQQAFTQAGQAQYNGQAQFPQQAVPATFSTDPFNTNGFQTTNQATPVQQQTPSTANPFIGGGSVNVFGTVLQPQPIPQPTAQPVTQPGRTDLFSDLNPLGGSIQPKRKEDFFSDVKNPQKPKLNELAPPQPEAAQQPANNNSNISSTHSSNQQTVTSDPFAGDPFFASDNQGGGQSFKSSPTDQAPFLSSAVPSCDDIFTTAPPSGPAPSLPSNVRIESTPAPPPRPQQRQQSAGLISPPPPAVKTRQNVQGPAPTPRPRQSAGDALDPFSTSSGD